MFFDVAKLAQKLTLKNGPFSAFCSLNMSSEKLYSAFRDTKTLSTQRGHYFDNFGSLLTLGVHILKRNEVLWQLLTLSNIVFFFGGGELNYHFRKQIVSKKQEFTSNQEGSKKLATLSKQSAIKQHNKQQTKQTRMRTPLTRNKRKQIKNKHLTNNQNKKR